MKNDFAKLAESIAEAARKGVQVELLWQRELERQSTAQKHALDKATKAA